MDREDLRTAELMDELVKARPVVQFQPGILQRVSYFQPGMHAQIVGANYVGSGVYKVMFCSGPFMSHNRRLENLDHHSYIITEHDVMLYPSIQNDFTVGICVNYCENEMAELFQLLPFRDGD